MTLDLPWLFVLLAGAVGLAPVDGRAPYALLLVAGILGLVL